MNPSGFLEFTAVFPVWVPLPERRLAPPRGIPPCWYGGREIHVSDDGTLIHRRVGDSKPFGGRDHPGFGR